MLQRTCGIEGCSRKTYIDRECFNCSEWHCPKHNTDEHHSCRTTPYEKQIAVLNEFKGRLALEYKEKILQDFPGYTVDLPSSSDLLGGSFNIHLPVTDTDGVKWLARVRCRDLGEFANMTTQSAAWTMQLLESANAFIPRIRLPPDLKDYYLIEVKQGKAGGYSLSEDIEALTEDQSKTLFRDLAQHLIGLSNTPTKGIGCLRRFGESLEAGPLLDMYPPLAESPYFLGPFKSTLDLYNAKIDDVLASLEREEEITTEVLSMYLAHLEIRRIINKCEEMGKEEEEHYIMHAESVGSQFLTKDGRLMAVLDWDWAIATTKAEAFAGAFWLWDMGNFATGSNDLSTPERMLVKAYQDLGRNDLADTLTNGKKYQRLWLGVGLKADLADVKGLQDAFGEAVDPQTSLEEWTQLAMERYKDSEGLKRIAARADATILRKR